MPPTDTAVSPVELDFPPLPGRAVSEDEFVAWCVDDTWAEWANGEIIPMAPVSDSHNDLSGFLLAVLRMLAEHHVSGKVRCEPMQVRLSAKERRSPDIFFVSQSRIELMKDTYFEGAPDFVLEIVSPESATRDRDEKYLAYEAAGVAEYWLVDPMIRQLSAWKLAAGKYSPIALATARVASTAVPGFALDPAWLWRDPLPTVAEVLRELGIR